MNDTTRNLAEPCVVALPHNRPIFLVGMMGAGKTTIGRSLAKILGREFVDLDQAIEARCGVPVSHIFEVEGEEGFRKRETLLLDEYSQQPGIVLATGGGAVLAAQNRRLLAERGVVVYLRASDEELYRRVAKDRNRPLLQTANPRARVTELLTQRAPLYEEVAHVAFDTGSMPIAQAADALVQLLKSTPVPS
ncbi:shikimate kinase [Pusillimonas sp. NJUB218]|uniref:shikimate kinase n=1 Tax=Pusillimonas sp. NJUB218 TaxID=2023230 RepID=UPI001F3F3F38|nr:shikimate kinase [Pusillimonas sp. NJUB218]